MTNKQIINQKQYQKLQNEIFEILSQSKDQIEKLANTILANSYWQIGKKIEEESLSENANYKNLLLQNLEQDLKIDKNTLSKTLRLYQSYPNGVQEGLSWSHYRRLITINDERSRGILTNQIIEQQWSVRQLESSIKDLNDGRISGNVVVVSENSSKSSAKIKRPTDPSYLYKAKVINVVDGDTLILNIDLGFKVIKEQRVRLTQIDAPEMKSEAGKKSHRYLRDVCAVIDEVAVKTNKIDIYGRYLVDVFYLPSDGKRGTTQSDIFSNGIYLNEKIVRDGFAISHLPSPAS